MVERSAPVTHPVDQAIVLAARGCIYPRHGKHFHYDRFCKTIMVWVASGGTVCICGSLDSKD